MKDIFDIPDRLETLDELQIRTGFVYEPQFESGFRVSPSVRAKVAAEESARALSGRIAALEAIICPATLACVKLLTAAFDALGADVGIFVPQARRMTSEKY